MTPMIPMYYYAVVYTDKDNKTLLRTLIAAENDHDARAIVEARAPKDAARYQYGAAYVKHAQSGVIDKTLGDNSLREMLNGLNQGEKEIEEAEKEAKKPRVVA